MSKTCGAVHPEKTWVKCELPLDHKTDHESFGWMNYKWPRPGVLVYKTFGRQRFMSVVPADEAHRYERVKL